MAGATFDVDFNSLAAQDSLNQLLHVMGDIKPAFRDIGGYLKIAHSERFKSHISPDGTPWASLKPSYLKRKKKNKNRILVLDDNLGRLLTYQIDGNELLFGSSLRYAATHQFGREMNVKTRTRTLYFKQDGKGGVGNLFVKKKIPARPFLGTSEADNLEILNIVIDHLDRALE